MRGRETMTDKHTPKDCATLDGPCGLAWDGLYNVEAIKFCPLHATAPELLKALEEWNPSGYGYSYPPALRARLGRTRAAIKAAKGDA
jgi:hypothetical protein